MDSTLVRFHGKNYYVKYSDLLNKANDKLFAYEDAGLTKVAKLNGKTLMFNKKDMEDKLKGDIKMPTRMPSNLATEQKFRKYIREIIMETLKEDNVFGIDPIPNMSSKELIEKIEHNIKSHILPYNLKDGNRVETEIREALHRFQRIEEWKQTTPKLINTLNHTMKKYMEPNNLGDMGETQELVKEVLKRLGKFYNK